MLLTLHKHGWKPRKLSASGTGLTSHQASSTCIASIAGNPSLLPDKPTVSVPAWIVPRLRNGQQE